MRAHAAGAHVHVMDHTHPNLWAVISFETIGDELILVWIAVERREYVL